MGCLGTAIRRFLGTLTGFCSRADWEIILTAREIREFKFYLAPCDVKGQTGLTLLSAFFDDPVSPLLISTPLVADDALSEVLSCNAHERCERWVCHRGRICWTCASAVTGPNDARGGSLPTTFAGPINCITDWRDERRRHECSPRSSLQVRLQPKARCSCLARSGSCK